MARFDYGAPAELFTGRSMRGSRRVRYHRFDTGAAALQFAIETLPREQLLGAILKVDEERYRHGEIRNLYDAGEYPLARPEPVSKKVPESKEAPERKQAPASKQAPENKQKSARKTAKTAALAEAK